MSQLGSLDRFEVLVSWRMNKNADCDRWHASHSIFCGRHYRQNVPGGLVLNDLSVLERRSNKALQTTPRGRFCFFHSFFGLPGRPGFGASKLVALGVIRAHESTTHRLPSCLANVDFLRGTDRHAARSARFSSMWHSSVWG
jgi:hypothetical protein